MLGGGRRATIARAAMSTDSVKLRLVGTECLREPGTPCAHACTWSDGKVDLQGGPALAAAIQLAGVGLFPRAILRHVGLMDDADASAPASTFTAGPVLDSQDADVLAKPRVCTLLTSCRSTDWAAVQCFRRIVRLPVAPTALPGPVRMRSLYLLQVHGLTGHGCVRLSAGRHVLGHWFTRTARVGGPGHVVFAMPVQVPFKATDVELTASLMPDLLDLPDLPDTAPSKPGCGCITAGLIEEDGVQPQRPGRLSFFRSVHVTQTRCPTSADHIVAVHVCFSNPVPDHVLAAWDVKFSGVTQWYSRSWRTPLLALPGRPAHDGGWTLTLLTAPEAGPVYVGTALRLGPTGTCALKPSKAMGGGGPSPPPPDLGPVTLVFDVLWSTALVGTRDAM